MSDHSDHRDQDGRYAFGVNPVDAVDLAAAIRVRAMAVDGVGYRILWAWVRGIATESALLRGDDVAMLDLAARIDRGER